MRSRDPRKPGQFITSSTTGETVSTPFGPSDNAPSDGVSGKVSAGLPSNDACDLPVVPVVLYIDQMFSEGTKKKLQTA